MRSPKLCRIQYFSSMNGLTLTIQRNHILKPIRHALRGAPLYTTCLKVKFKESSTLATLGNACASCPITALDFGVSVRLLPRATPRVGKLLRLFMSGGGLSRVVLSGCCS